MLCADGRPLSIVRYRQEGGKRKREKGWKSNLECHFSLPDAFLNAREGN